jgi:uncharacterized protein (TIGR02246 family)
MKLILQLTFAATLAATLTAPALAGPPQVTRIEAHLRGIETRWNADIVARDPVKFASYYDDHATLINPGALPLVGRNAIQAGMARAFADPNFSLRFAADDAGVSRDGQMAWTRGHCVVTETDPASHAKVTENCTYVTVYVLEADGSWKAMQDISTPAP